jgi:hypothetical protein
VRSRIPQKHGEIDITITPKTPTDYLNYSAALTLVDPAQITARYCARAHTLCTTRYSARSMR